jgi:hypothetical protein
VKWKIGALLSRLREAEWVVYAKRPFAGPEQKEKAECLKSRNTNGFARTILLRCLKEDFKTDCLAPLF